MRLFEENTILTSQANEVMSNLDIYLGLSEDDRVFLPGTYNYGLITICGNQRYTQDLMQSWEYFEKRKILPIAINAWGDLIYMEKDIEYVKMFFPQSHKGIEIEIEPHKFIVYILRNEEAREEYLQADKFQTIYDKLGPIRYGKCYYHNPWQLWNITEELSGWKIGDNSIYLDLVGQTWPQRSKVLEDMKKAGKEGRPPKIKISISDET